MNRAMLIAGVIAGVILLWVYVQQQVDDTSLATPQPADPRESLTAAPSPVQKQSATISNATVSNNEVRESARADVAFEVYRDLGEPLDVGLNFASAVEVETRHLGEFIDTNAEVVDEGDAVTTDIGEFVNANDFNQWSEESAEQRFIGEPMEVDDHAVITREDLEGKYVDLGERIQVELDK